MSDAFDDDPRAAIDARDQYTRPRRADRHGAGEPLRAARDREQITIPPDFGLPRRSRRGARTFRSTGRRTSTSSAVTS